MNNAKTILLVEDNPDDEELTLLAIQRSQIAAEVVVAHDGVEALEYLFQTPSAQLPRLILLDLKLPKLGGLEVLQRLRADARTQLIPVVVLTSSSEEADIRASYSFNANSYIRKSIDFRNFVETIRQLVYYWFIINQAPPQTHNGFRLNN
jgi:CheY-like chemotaxis protein